MSDDNQKINFGMDAPSHEVKTEIGAEALMPPSKYWVDVIRRFCKNKIAVIGLIMLTIIVVLCAFAPFFTSYHPVLDMDLINQLQRPGSSGHLLGTDDLGRDIWTRLLYGGRTSVLTGLAIALISGFVGVVLGLVAGYFGGLTETLIMRATDIMVSFPLTVVAVAIIAVLGPSQKNIILTLAIVGWPRFTRLIRGQVLSIKNSEYVESAKVAGFKNRRIIFRHVLPNCIGPLIVQTTLAVGSAILSSATLSYLGLGADVAAPDWGMMLSQGKNYLRLAPYLTTIPGIAISVTVLSINWIGDGLRDAFDPRMRK